MIEKLVQIMYSGVIGSASYELIKKLFKAPEINDDTKEYIENINQDNTKNESDQSPLFHVFDIANDFDGIADLLGQSTLHILIEEKRNICLLRFLKLWLR